MSLRLTLALAFAACLPAAAQAEGWHLQAGPVGLLVDEAGYSILLPGPALIFGGFGAEPQAWGPSPDRDGGLALADLPALIRSRGPEGQGLRVAAHALTGLLEGADYNEITGPPRNRHAIAFLADAVFAHGLPGPGVDTSPAATLGQAEQVNALLGGADGAADLEPPSPEATLAEAKAFNERLQVLAAPAGGTKARARLQPEAPEGERPAKRHRP